MTARQDEARLLYALRYDDALFPTYGNWNAFSGKMLKLFPVCCFPGCPDRACNLHHAAYQTPLGEPLGENGILGIHFFTLCDRHHNHREDPECVHHPENWNPGILPPPRLDAIQHPRMYIMLRNEFKVKYSETKLRLSR